MFRVLRCSEWIRESVRACFEKHTLPLLVKILYVEMLMSLTLSQFDLRMNPSSFFSTTAERSFHCCSLRRLGCALANLWTSSLASQMRIDSGRQQINENSPCSSSSSVPASRARERAIESEKMKVRGGAAKIESRSLKSKRAWRCSFSAGSTPIFTTKYSLERSRQDLSDLHASFVHPSALLQSQNFSNFQSFFSVNVRIAKSLYFQILPRFPLILMKFSRSNCF